MLSGMAESKASWELAEGDEIAPGRSVLKLLGGGNRYEAYLVWDERLFSPMVAKVIRPDQAEDESALRGLAREAEALDVLAHPVILRGFDSVLAPPHPHVLVEHLEGPTLRRLIKRSGTLPAEQALPLALHVASALHYMAAEGWVHLDLKPDNIVMGIPPRVIDMSLARTVERAARLSGYVGTNAYASPEQCVPNGDVGPAAGHLGARRHPLPRRGRPAAVPAAGRPRGRRRPRGALPAARGGGASVAAYGCRLRCRTRSSPACESGPRATDRCGAGWVAAAARRGATLEARAREARRAPA